jgi:acetylornithine aminotransferase
MNLEEIDKKFVMQTYARDYTNFIKGEGSLLFDDKNRDYIDFASGIGVNSVGHNNPILVDKLTKQLSNIIHISNLQVIEPQAYLAKRLAEISGYDMVSFFANSGAEANEGAIKLARKYGQIKFHNKRYKVITLEHSFHGRTITTVKATGQEIFHNDNFSPYPDGFSYVKDIESIYKNIDDETVAVMIELIQGEGGVEPFDKTQIQELASFLKDRDILFIIDEVQTGIYRTGEFLASNLYEIEPDIITLAKGLGGGVPIGVVMSKHKDILVIGDHGSTFGGNYLSTTAGLAVLDILEKLYKENSINQTILYFEDKLKNIVQNYPDKFNKSVGIGLMRGLRVNSNKILNKIMKESIQNRLILLKAGRNTVRFLPPITITKDEIDKGFQRFNKVLEKL